MTITTQKCHHRKTLKQWARCAQSARWWFVFNKKISFRKLYKCQYGNTECLYVLILSVYLHQY